MKASNRDNRGNGRNREWAAVVAALAMSATLIEIGRAHV